MKTITDPKPVETPVAQIPADDREECRLVAKRANDPAHWTFDDHTNLMRLQRKAQLRQEAELMEDNRTEARAFPASANPHDD